MQTFSIPRYKKVKYGKHSLRYLGPLVWTKLNEKERASYSIDNFRNCIRKKTLRPYLKTTHAMIIVGFVTFLEISTLIYYFL